MFYKIKLWDRRMIEKISQHSTPFLDKVMIWITRLGNSGLIWAVIAFCFLFKKSSRIVSLKIFFVLVLTAIMSEFILKHIFGRHRPSENLSKDELLLRKPKSYSFPSGHTVSSFACAMSLSITFPYLWVIIPTFLLASVIGFSRIYLKVHYPTDVCAGAFIGVLFAFLVEFILSFDLILNI